MVAPRKVLQFYPATTTSPRTLSPAQVADFNEEGYLAPIDIFSPGEALANRDFFDRLMARAGEQGWNSYDLVNFELHCASIYDLIMEPRILDVVEDLLGPNIISFGAHFFCKMPGDTKQVTWHQDAPYYELSPSKSLTAWLAIDDVDEANSAMQVIPKSHLHGEIGMEESTAEEQNVLTRTVRDPEAHGDAPVSINLRAGQISIHTDLLLHGSKPNCSDRRRCGVAIRYAPADIRALTTWNQVSFVCRGVEPSGHWANNPRPAGDRVPVRPPKGVSLLDVTETVSLDPTTRSQS